MPDFLANNSVIKNLGLKHLLITAKDETSFALKQFFEETADFINDAIKKGNVLVHCVAGVSRSTTCLISFYVKY